MYLFLKVNNKSNKRIGGVYVVFYQYLVFHANGKKKNDNECVAYQMRYMILKVWVRFENDSVFCTNIQIEHVESQVSYLITTFRKPSDPLIKSKVEVIDDDGEKSDNEEEGKDDGKSDESGSDVGGNTE